MKLLLDQDVYAKTRHFLERLGMMLFRWHK